MAKALKTLSETEGRRRPSCRLNLDNGLNKDHETKSFRQVLELPVSTLQGLSAKADVALGELGVETVGDFASFTLAAIAEAIVVLAPFEQTRTSEERKRERLLRNLG